VETISGQSWSRQAHPLLVPGWTGDIYRLISHVRSNITRKWGTAFNQAAWNQDRKMLLKQNKTNAKRETETLKMGTAPRNRRGHLQLNKTHGQSKR
jgi:hypothetical protein